MRDPCVSLCREQGLVPLATSELMELNVSDQGQSTEKTLTTRSVASWRLPGCSKSIIRDASPAAKLDWAGKEGWSCYSLVMAEHWKEDFHR